MAKLEKLVAHAQEHLEDGEEVIAAVDGTYETERFGTDSIRSGVLIATDRRVVFYAKKMTGYELESFPYENISSFEQGKNMMGGTIKFFASGNTASMKWIKADGLAALTDTVKARMGKSAAASATPSGVQDDIPAQIGKLAELHDAGILTDAEFEAKKRDLLDRM